jgi:hypothetical protein
VFSERVAANWPHKRHEFVSAIDSAATMGFMALCSECQLPQGLDAIWVRGIGRSAPRPCLCVCRRCTQPSVNRCWGVAVSERVQGLVWGGVRSGMGVHSLPSRHS